MFDFGASLWKTKNKVSERLSAFLRRQGVRVLSLGVGPSAAHCFALADGETPRRAALIKKNLHKKTTFFFASTREVCLSPSSFRESESARLSFFPTPLFLGVAAGGRVFAWGLNVSGAPPRRKCKTNTPNTKTPDAKTHTPKTRRASPKTRRASPAGARGKLWTSAFVALTLRSRRRDLGKTRRKLARAHTQDANSTLFLNLRRRKSMTRVESQRVRVLSRVGVERERLCFAFFLNGDVCLAST